VLEFVPFPNQAVVFFSCASTLAPFFVEILRPPVFFPAMKEFRTLSFFLLYPEAAAAFSLSHEMMNVVSFPSL